MMVKNNKKGNSRNKKMIGILIMMALFFWFLYYLISHVSDFKQISIINPAYIIPVFLISFFLFITNGLLILYMLIPFGIRLEFKEWFGLSVTTTLYNTITPFRGGSIVRATYLKNKHRFLYVHFLAIMSVAYMLNLIVVGFFGLLSLAIIYLRQEALNWVVLLLFAVFLMPFAFMLLIPLIPERENPFLNKLIGFLNGLRIIVKDKSILFIVLSVIFFQYILLVVGTILSYEVIGVKLKLVESMFLVSVGHLSSIIAITPSGLGIVEAVQVFSALVIGIKPAQSITISLLGRIIALPIIFGLGPLYSYILFKKAMRNRL